MIATPEQVAALVHAVWQMLDDMGPTGQSVCGFAKAQARVAIEPWRAEAGDEDFPLDMPLTEAVKIMKECGS